MSSSCTEYENNTTLRTWLVAVRDLRGLRERESRPGRPWSSRWMVHTQGHNCLWYATTTTTTTSLLLIYRYVYSIQEAESVLLLWKFFCPFPARWDGRDPTLSGTQPRIQCDRLLAHSPSLCTTAVCILPVCSDVYYTPPPSILSKVKAIGI